MTSLNQLQDEAQNVAEHKCGNSNEADDGKAKQESMQVNIVNVGKGLWPTAQSLIGLGQLGQP